MALNFETPEERLKKKVNILLFGESGVGKTYAARTLQPETTLFVDGEAGSLALGDWQGTVLNIRKEAARLGWHPWYMCRAIACLLSGPDPKAEEGNYCEKAYNYYKLNLGDGIFDKFDTIFLDSVTVVSRWAFDWSQKQPEAFSEKTGKPDTRGAYGLLGRELIEWATQLQHQPKSIILSCILEEKTDEFSRKFFSPQIMGSMASREIPGIFDVVLTLARFPSGQEESASEIPRWFVTQQGNQYGYPAKDRSDLLDDFEQPNLGKLIDKIKGKPTT
jgi:hypothetical protein